MLQNAYKKVGKSFILRYKLQKKIFLHPRNRTSPPNTRLVEVVFSKNKQCSKGYPAGKFALIQNGTKHKKVVVFESINVVFVFISGDTVPHVEIIPRGHGFATTTTCTSERTRF